MKCAICGKEFEQLRGNQYYCSTECRKENERRWQAAYYKRTKGTRTLTKEQVEKNKIRNRDRYRNMDPEKKKRLLAEKRRKYRESKKKKEN